MTPLEIALACIRRGLYVLPIPNDDKEPLYALVPHGVYGGTLEESKVRHWWGKAKPDANVGIAAGLSGLAVHDCDHGNATFEDFEAWRQQYNLPKTYTVRTGRRNWFGTHSYYRVPKEIKSGSWEFDGHKGEIRSQGYYVLAAGCLHPDTRLPYEVLFDAEIVDFPEHINDWRKVKLGTFNMTGNGKLDELREGFEALGIEYDDRGHLLCVRCPWKEGHSMESGPTETVVFVKDGVYCFKCHHSSCDGRSYAAFRAEVLK